MSEGPDIVDELAIDLLEDFDGVDFSEEQIERLNDARENLWKTLALLTFAVPETLTDDELQNMHRALKACLMLRNTIRATVLEARQIPIPTPDELEAYRESITPIKETIH